MMVVLVSASGAPGVTTTAAALTAVGGRQWQTLLVEMDPSGGDLECWTGVTGEPGLVRLVNDLRGGAHPDSVWAHALEASPGVPAVLAPTSGLAADATLSAAGEGLSPMLAALDALVIVDAGRWAPSQATAGRVSGASLIGVVCPPTVNGLAHAREMIGPLRALCPALVAVMVGDRPHGRAEAEAVLGVPVAGVVRWDRRAVDALFLSGISSAWGWTPLARSARVVLERLVVGAEVEIHV